METNNQRMAQAAYQQIMKRRPDKKFTGFARKFPALVHSCGLAQSVAFAMAEGGHQEDYLSDLSVVLQAAGYSAITSNDQLAKMTRDEPVTRYLRLSRHSLLAAVWLKRYVDAAGEQPVSAGGK